MTTIAYLANQFPSSVEPYVVDEIQELRKRGIQVLPCSARRTGCAGEVVADALADETFSLQSAGLATWLRATWICLRHMSTILSFTRRALAWRREPFGRKLRALPHTYLGACFAAHLAGRGVRHIHVHHGYFSAWVAMVAARLLRISFSMTLHGSDLLGGAPYLDIKLAECQFCVTVSEFNRRHLLHQHPQVGPEKILVRRLGVALPLPHPAPGAQDGSPLVMLAVGRLHAVKNHAFLIQACRLLQNRGLPVLCLIAGEGPERNSLQQLAADLHLQSSVSLLGHISRQELDQHYRSSDLVVLTSRSEGLPLVLMEAMSHSRPVLAPAITGIPELVVHGWTGFLYRQGSLADFVGQVERIAKSRATLGPVAERARQGVLERFNRERNLAEFADTMLDQIRQPTERDLDEDLVLQ